MISNLQAHSVKCKFCRSTAVVRNGKRENNTQYWLCTICGHGFIDNSALPGMKYTQEAITSAVNQYFSGTPIGSICRQVEHQTGSLPSYSTIYSWIKRVAEIAVMETKSYKPEVSDTWIVDETVLSLKGKKHWLLDLIDSETRVLLAVELSQNRHKSHLHTIMEKARSLTGKSPRLLLINGWKGYADGLPAAKSENQAVQVQMALEPDKLQYIERSHNGQIDRFNIMRGLKKAETAEAVLPGWIIYYNYFRPHPGLNNLTPAEKAGILCPFRSWRDIVNSQVLIAPQLNVNSEGRSIMIPIRKPYRKRNIRQAVNG